MVPIAAHFPGKRSKYAKFVATNPHVMKPCMNRVSNRSEECRYITYC